MIFWMKLVEKKGWNGRCLGGDSQLYIYTQCCSLDVQKMDGLFHCWQIILFCSLERNRLEQFSYWSHFSIQQQHQYQRCNKEPGGINMIIQECCVAKLDDARYKDRRPKKKGKKKNPEIVFIQFSSTCFQSRLVTASIQHPEFSIFQYILRSSRSISHALNSFKIKCLSLMFEKWKWA